MLYLLWACWRWQRRTITRRNLMFDTILIILVFSNKNRESWIYTILNSCPGKSLIFRVILSCLMSNCLCSDFKKNWLLYWPSLDWFIFNDDLICVQSSSSSVPDAMRFYLSNLWPYFCLFFLFPWEGIQRKYIWHWRWASDTFLLTYLLMTFVFCILLWVVKLE